MRPIHLLVVAVGAAAIAAPCPRPAEACGNAMILATDANVRAIKEAEEKLNDGNPAEAATVAEKKLLPAPLVANWHSMTVNAGTKDKAELLANRALRIFTLACVRLDGAIGPWGNAMPWKRKANVQWATSLLKGLHWAKPGDAASKTDYAEALAKTGAPEAKTMLEELAARDVLATPYAYAALAALRASADDAAGRDAALAKCKTMAAKPSICEPPRQKPAG